MRNNSQKACTNKKKCGIINHGKTKGNSQSKSDSERFAYAEIPYACCQEQENLHT